MNGDQKTTTPESEWQHKPVDTPPSLSEPSQRRSVTPTPLQSDRPELNKDKNSPNNIRSKAQQSPIVTDPLAAEVANLDGDSASFYRPETDEAVDFTVAPVPSQATPEKTVEWTSSGDELRLRASAWRVRMTLLSLVAAVIIYVLTRDIISAGSVGVVGLLFGFLGSRRPPSLTYTVDSQGINIGQRHYAYSDFRAFTVSDDVQSPSINLVPLKRFLPILALHYDSKLRDEIIDVLAAHLPLEIPKRDAIDSIINKVKF